MLVTTGPGGIFEARLVNRSLGSVVNVLRSIPFLILMVALIPFTRLIVGTSYGVWAAVVPLTIAATPFFARIAEVSLREVDFGLVEAAQAMGCQRRHIIWNVLLPEARPGIVGGFTITLVTMINSSAMAGAIGAGGLGDLAYRYGYQRFDTQIMLTVIILLVVLVTLIQFGGDRLARLLNKRWMPPPWGIAFHVAMGSAACAALAEHGLGAHVGFVSFGPAASEQKTMESHVTSRGSPRSTRQGLGCSACALLLCVSAGEASALRSRTDNLNCRRRAIRHLRTRISGCAPVPAGLPANR